MPSFEQPSQEKERRYGDIPKEIIDELEIIGEAIYTDEKTRSIWLNTEKPLEFMRTTDDDGQTSWSVKKYESDQDEEGVESPIENQEDIANLNELSEHDIPKAAFEAFRSNASVLMDYDKPIATAIAEDGTKYKTDGLYPEYIGIIRGGKQIGFADIKMEKDRDFLEKEITRLVNERIASGDYNPFEV